MVTVLERGETSNPAAGNADAAARLIGGLRRRGVEVVFSHALPGSVRLAAERLGVGELPCRAGETAAAMAQGYACAGNRVGVAMAGGESAAAELVAPLAGALQTGVPLLVVVQPTGPVEPEPRALLAPAARLVREIRSAADIEPVLMAAFAVLEGPHPGPVVVLLAPDLLAEMACPEPSDPPWGVCPTRPAAAAARHSARPETAGAEPVPIPPARLMAELAHALGARGILVTEAAPGLPQLRPLASGGSCRWAVCPSRALPVALGARLAAPTAPVICLVGPGLEHGWADLQTARRMHLPVVMVVRNPAGGPAIDHAIIAAACGCVGIRVEQAEEFATALRAALAANRATVIDVLTEADPV